MKFRDRFRKALFAFFKEEILKEVQVPQDQLGLIHNKEIIRTSNIPVQTLEYTIQLDSSEHTPFKFGEPADFVFNRAAAKAHKELFDELIRHVTVDSRALLDPSIYGRREIRFSVLVGKP
jgi:hypothetical protein